jgi:predicted CxxxxCH...CXXCH cytochrome family protein
MRNAVFGALCWTTAAAVLGLGCSSSPPSANSFTQVYTTVLAPNCTNVYCHINGANVKYFGGLDMSNQTIAYWSLVDHLLEGPSCSDATLGRRVLPYHPEKSILYLKVSETNPPCGVQMPADPYAQWPSGTTNPQTVFSGTPLPADQQQLIYNWIKDGAQNN